MGSVGSYSAADIKVYQDYVRCGGVLILLSDQKAPGEADDLAAAFGLQVAGAVADEAMVTSYGSDPAFVDLPPLSVEGGTGLAGADEHTRRIGATSAGTFLDLNSNGRRDTAEPTSPTVLAVRPYGRGTVAFLGTTSIFDRPGHPLMGQLLRYLMPEGRWAKAIGRDRFEPDDTPSTARPLDLGEIQDGRTLHGNDNDWVTFRLTVGDRVTLSTTGSCDTHLYLHGAADTNTPLAQDDDSGQGSNAQITFTATEDGTYLARVRHFSEVSGTCEAYRLVSSVAR